MLYKKLMVILLTGLMSTATYAELYLELAVEGGGENLIATNTGQAVSAGGGVRFAAGIQNPVNGDGSASLRLAVGYLFDDLSAYNGVAEMNALTFDALYLVNSGPHSIGFGGTVHMAPQYRDDVAGYRPLKIEYDDAYGLLFQYGYHPLPGLEMGVRVSSIEYENGLDVLDASSFGLFISNGF